jgi:hypothetical protein
VWLCVWESGAKALLLPSEDDDTHPSPSIFCPLEALQASALFGERAKTHGGRMGHYKEERGGGGEARALCPFEYVYEECVCPKARTLAYLCMFYYGFPTWNACAS